MVEWNGMLIHKLDGLDGFYTFHIQLFNKDHPNFSDWVTNMHDNCYTYVNHLQENTL